MNMNCENCKNYEKCLGFAEMFGHCKFEPIRVPDWEKLEETGEDGFMENPRVPFSVI